MLDDSFADLERQIESGEIQVALLELLDDTKRVQIVIEPAAMRTHQFVELAFSGVPERRVPDVMNQSQRFGQIGIESQRPRYRAGNLRHLQRMCEAIAKVIGIPRRENLRFCFEAPERPRVNHTVAVPRINAPVRMQRLRITPSARLCRKHRIRNQRHTWILCQCSRYSKFWRLLDGPELVVFTKTISPHSALC